MIEAVRRLRNYRDSVGAPAAARIPARIVGDAYEDSLDAIGAARAVRHRRWTAATARPSARSRLDGATVEVLPSDTVDPAEARARLEAEREAAAGGDRAERAASSPTRGSPTKAPPELVQAEQDKLERFEAELAELEA